MANELGIYIMFTIGGMLLLNMWTKGFVLAWIKVKALKMGNVLVCVVHPVQDYYVPGSLDKNILSFIGRKRTTNDKPKRSMTLPNDVIKEAIFRSFNCDCIQVDDAKDSVYIRRNASYESTPGFNAEQMAEELDTAMKKPSPEDQTYLAPGRFQIYVLIGILVLGLGGYFIYQKIMGLYAGVHVVEGKVDLLVNTLVNNNTALPQG